MSYRSMKLDTPLVSVVMPVYNVEAYVEQAVKSVLSQTFTDFELLIIDDETPDNSIELIASLTAQDERVRVIKQKNRGLAGARNTGIREALGKFIAFLDSDDYWHHQKLEQHISLMQSQAKPGVTFSASMFINEAGNVLNKIQTPFIKRNYTARNIFCRNPIGNGSAPVIRKNILEQIAFKGNNKQGQSVAYWQYFDESLKQSEDIDCWTRIALQSATDFALIDSPLTYYRLNNAGLSADINEQFKTWLSFVDKLALQAPDFVHKHAAAAKAFQCRYIARRCLSRADGKCALKWCMDALKHSPLALLEESRRSVSTLTASLVFALLPKPQQMKILKLVI